MILKVQRQFNTPGPLMVYNRERSVVFMVDETPELLKLFGDRLKVYVKGSVVEIAPGAKAKSLLYNLASGGLTLRDDHDFATGRLVIEQECETQPW